MSSINGYRKIIQLLKDTSTETLQISKDKSYLDREHLSVASSKSQQTNLHNRIKSTKLMLHAMKSIVYSINSTSILTDDYLWWRQCNVMSKKTDMKKNEKGALSITESTDLRSPIGPDTGYTCGLWLLLHYLTGDNDVSKRSVV